MRNDATEFKLWIKQFKIKVKKITQLRVKKNVDIMWNEDREKQSKKKEIQSTNKKPLLKLEASNLETPTSKLPNSDYINILNKWSSTKILVLILLKKKKLRKWNFDESVFLGPRVVGEWFCGCPGYEVRKNHKI